MTPKSSLCHSVHVAGSAKFVVKVWSKLVSRDLGIFFEERGIGFHVIP